jgi:hypothetical protein
MLAQFPGQTPVVKGPLRDAVEKMRYIPYPVVKAID